jgi:hypothetical protein
MENRWPGNGRARKLPLEVGSDTAGVASFSRDVLLGFRSSIDPGSSL